jgi:hypothetical protein
VFCLVAVKGQDCVIQELCVLVQVTVILGLSDSDILDLISKTFALLKQNKECSPVEEPM